MAKSTATRFQTLSGIPVEPLYGSPAPGEFPYTRGIHREMYRAKLWTMRQFAGFSTPEETKHTLQVPAGPDTAKSVG